MLRDVIFSDVVLIVNDKRIDNVDLKDDSIDIYDDYEVIGIRSNAVATPSMVYSCVVVSLKPTAVPSYDTFINGVKLVTVPGTTSVNFEKDDRSN